jgi:hypothetical protein
MSSTTSLADRIRANRKSRSPVQDTVEQLFDQISDAIARGSSYREIHHRLTREGHNVGARHNSLFAAIKVVKARRERDGVAPSEPRRELPAAIVDTRRKTTVW